MADLVGISPQDFTLSRGAGLMVVSRPCARRSSRFFPEAAVKSSLHFSLLPAGATPAVNGTEQLKTYHA
jgi:hypothetical protein